MSEEKAIPPEDEPSPVEVLEPSSPRGEMISEPAKLLRIVSMVRELLDETRQTTIDEPGRARLRQIYERSISELNEVLSPDLQEELASLTIPLDGTPSESEIRIAQAQLVGWLEGLFHGIQAAIWSQQMAARAQFEELRRRGLPPGASAPDQVEQPMAGPGQYL